MRSGVEEGHSETVGDLVPGHPTVYPTVPGHPGLSHGLGGVPQGSRPLWTAVVRALCTAVEGTVRAVLSNESIEAPPELAPRHPSHAEHHLWPGSCDANPPILVRDEGDQSVVG